MDDGTAPGRGILCSALRPTETSTYVDGSSSTRNLVPPSEPSPLIRLGIAGGVGADSPRVIWRHEPRR